MYREKLEPILQYAGELALSLRKEGLKTDYKHDNSPVTNGDIAVSDFLIAALSAAFPGDAIISEEHHDCTDVHAERRWFVDPIDGTKHYVAGKDNWCIMVCLVEKDPVFSIVYYPVLNKWLWAEQDKGAWLREGKVTRQVRIRESHIPLVKHSSKAIHKHGEESSQGTMKHVFQLLLGELDCYVNSHIHYWDLAAPMLLITEAGGVMLDEHGNTPTLTDESLVLDHYVAGHPVVVKQVLDEIKKTL